MHVLWVRWDGYCMFCGLGRMVIACSVGGVWMRMVVIVIGWCILISDYELLRHCGTVQLESRCGTVQLESEMWQ